jgi:prepilin-type N-terminal cleavage/methylation domain-containing protein
MLFEKKGFTLVELAIVVTIIAIIITGIIVGNDILNATRLQSVIKEMNGYNNSVKSFYIKYQAIPGDMDNATDYWVSTGNGDGDGYISDSVGWNEASMSAHHLYLAEEISFNSTFGSLYTVHGYYPESSISNAFYYFRSRNYFNTDNYNYISLAATLATSNFVFLTVYPIGVMDGKSAKSIDLKVDDGNPSSGIFIADHGIDPDNITQYNSGCITASSGSVPYTSSLNEGEAEYDLNDSTKSCVINLKLDAIY